MSETSAKKTKRTERLKIQFGPDGRAIGWVFDVSEAFRAALDIQYVQLVDREQTRRARAHNPKAAPVHRMAWTQGVPPVLSFERGHIFYEPHGIRGTEKASGGPPWGDALQILRRIVQVREATPDISGGSRGWVSFQIWTIVAGELGTPETHRCSQGAFGEFLRTGELPPR